MGVIEKARQMRSQIEQIAATIPDDSATEYADLFPKWNGDGTAYTLGARVRIDGVLYKCLQATLHKRIGSLQLLRLCGAKSWLDRMALRLANGSNLIAPTRI